MAKTGIRSRSTLAQEIDVKSLVSRSNSGRRIEENMTI